MVNMNLGQYLNLLQKGCGLWHDAPLNSGIVGAMLSEHAVNILACPTCKERLELIEAGAFLLCLSCHVKFPVRENIPVLSVEELIPAKGDKIGCRLP